jgi:ABC-type antimicrobial peptide transport system permease subunit
LDIVTLRRESSRAQHVPFWRRLNLDFFFASLLLVGYIAFVYFWPSITTAGNQIDPNIYVLLTDLGFLASPLFVAAVLLLFLRFFPWIVRLASSVVAKKRGASAVLALAQMERTPRPAARIIVLLALAIASSSFLFILIATKDQRNIDVANFYVQAADFSGHLPESDASKTFSQLKTYYSGLAGVQSATLGYYDVIQLSSDQSTNGQGSLTIDAVDADTYARTAIWSPVYSSQALSDLTAQLVSHRSDGISQNVVYALVDAAAWQRLHLSQGEHFTLPVDSSGSPQVHFIALAQINYVPGLNDSSSLTWSGMGLIVDYLNYTSVKAKALGETASSLPPNYIWLRTRDDAASLTSIRNALPDLVDRRNILTIMQNNPDHLGIIGVMAIGVAAALILALIGTLLSSWHNAANRLTNFAIIRALGMAPRQIAAVLLWEQGFIYTLAFLLGIGLGGLLTIFVAPTISALTIMHGDIGNGGAPNVPPIQVIIPYFQLVLLLGVLVILCLAALLLMACIVSRPALSQTLRLNED